MGMAHRGCRGGNRRRRAGPRAGVLRPTGSTSYQPEIDAYFRLADGLRLQAQVQPYLVPAQQVSQTLLRPLRVAGTWPTFLRDLLSPDEAKNHAVDVRLGVIYNATLDAGTGSPGNLWTVQVEITPRYNLPGEIQASLRNRVSFSWAVDGASGFTFRYRGRFQLEREFDVATVPVTPFVNVELFWQQPPAMWTQFRIQGGVQVGFEWFARGQAVELNWSAITDLQPSRSWAPQVGLVLSSYF